MLNHVPLSQAIILFKIRFTLVLAHSKYWNRNGNSKQIINNLLINHVSYMLGA